MRMSKYVLTILLILSGYALTAQVYNPIPQYVFRNKLGVGRSTPVDDAAYMNIGPNGGANQGVVLPRVADTLSILGTKRHGLLIFSRQLNKFAWWDSTGNKWTEVGSGSGSSGGEVMLMNGSSTVGDSLLMPSVSGDSAFIKNLLAGSDFEIIQQGDSVLVLNAKNIGNTDLTSPDDRTLTMASGKYFTVSSTGTDGGSFLQYLWSGSPDGSIESINYNERREAGIYYKYQPTGLSSVSISGIRGAKRLGDTSRPVLNLFTDNGIFIGNTSGNWTGSNVIEIRGTGYLDSIILFAGSKDTVLHWNTITGRLERATVQRQLTTYPNSANATVSGSDSYVILSDLTGAAARTVTMPTGATGKTITIINKSSDGSLKWTFASTVTDIAGATVTAIDDLSSYTLLYDGSNWIIINKY